MYIFKTKEFFIIDLFLEHFIRISKTNITAKLHIFTVIKTFSELPSYRTAENFEVPQFGLDAFVQ